MKRFRREVALVLEGGPYGENVVRINFLDLPWGLGLLASKQDEIFIDEVMNVFSVLCLYGRMHRFSAVTKS